MKIEVELEWDTGSHVIRTRLKGAIETLETNMKNRAREGSGRAVDEVNLAALRLALRYFSPIDDA
jgi:hypothetical protein